jgi:hypothetical protein
MDLTYPTMLAATSVLAWWLSGFDGAVTGESRAKDLKRRLIRCGITLVLMAVGLGAALGNSRFGGFIVVAVVLPLALIWTGCLSEAFARVFHRLVDSPDSREFDPNELTRELDTLAALVQQGKNNEAVQLAMKLKKSASGSPLALEATLFRVYDQMLTGNAASPALAEAQRLYDEGHCLQAEYRLQQVLKHEPGNLTAGIMLMKLYAENLHDRNRALALLRTFEQGRSVPTCFIDYARQRINEWFDPSSVRQKSVEDIESVLVQKKHEESPEEELHPKFSSVADLLAAGHLGTAIERLEGEIRENPHNFESRLQLAEAYGRYCCNFTRAREIVAKIETNPAFSPAQVRQAKAKLQEWRTRRPSGQFAS